MRTLFLFLVFFSSYSYSEQDYTAIPSTHPDLSNSYAYSQYPPYHPTQSGHAIVRINACNASKGGQFCFWDNSRVWYSNELVADLPPPDPYACPENQIRFSVDGQDSFCGSASSSCDALVDVVIGSGANGSCTDTRNNFPIGGTCGDNSLVCWTSTDTTVLPPITGLDTPVTSTSGGLLSPPPEIDTDVQVIDDGVTTITNTETTTINNNGDTVTEKTTTTTNNSTGASTTTTTQKTTNENGDITINGATKETTGEDQAERSSSGGDSCIVPPSCSGDAIDCATQKQVWLLRCDGESSSSDPLSCSSTYECDGDPIFCAFNKVQNENYCSLEQYAGQTAVGVYEAEGLTTVDSMSAGSAFDGVTEDIGSDVSGFVSSISSAGNNVTSSCPSPIVVSFGKLGNFEVSYIGVCGLAEITRPILIFFAIFYSMFGLVQVLRGNK
jgi:hypothetical protein